MAKLINCKSCGKEVSKGAKSCPNCGADQRSFFAKHKVLTVIGALVIIGIIGSLGGGDDTNNSSNTVNNEQTAPVQVEPKEAPTVVTTDELIDALDANALNASKTYKGNYVELTGVLSNIDSSGSYFSLDRNDGEFNMTIVQCYITKDHEDTVASFTKDQTITVVGTISEVGEVMGYSLKVESIK